MGRGVVSLRFLADSSFQSSQNSRSRQRTLFDENWLIRRFEIIELLASNIYSKHLSRSWIVLSLRNFDSMERSSEISLSRRSSR